MVESDSEWFLTSQSLTQPGAFLDGSERIQTWILSELCARFSSKHSTGPFFGLVSGVFRLRRLPPAQIQPVLPWFGFSRSGLKEVAAMIDGIKVKSRLGFYFYLHSGEVTAVLSLHSPSPLPPLRLLVLLPPSRCEPGESFSASSV